MYPKVFLAIIGFMFSFSPTYSQNNSIQFIQDGKISTISTRVASIRLNRVPFAFRFYSKPYNAKKKKFYSAQVAVMTNPADTNMFQVGERMLENQYLGPGTGMAPGENGLYDAIFISDSGHHYLFYGDEDDKRVALIKRNKILELEWKVGGAYYQEKDMTLSDLPLSTLYWVVFVDSNLNDRIDRDECKIVTMEFN